jgi:chorismate dehydratase
MPPQLPRCGRISYTNDLPVYAGIDAGALLFPGSMVAGVPSQLNAAILDGDLDISPVSSALYAEHAESLALLPGVCIGAAQKVHSIALLSAVPPERLAGRTIAVTTESLTGRILLQVICRIWHGFDPVLAPSDDPLAQHLADGTPCLLIGDKAIDAAQAVPGAAIHDLGELWHRFTGMGMVYAVWAVRDQYLRDTPDQTRSVAAALKDSLDWGLANIGRVIERAHAIRPRAQDFYGEYYRALNFRFDRTAREALEKFFAIAADAGVLKAAPRLRFLERVPEHA